MREPWQMANFDYCDTSAMSISGISIFSSLVTHSECSTFSLSDVNLNVATPPFHLTGLHCK